MRRRFYGKPLPAKRQVRAHLDLLDLVKKADDMNVVLQTKEVSYLRRLVAADFQIMVRNMDHAISHGSEVILPDADTAAEILEKLDDK